MRLLGHERLERCNVVVDVVLRVVAREGGAVESFFACQPLALALQQRAVRVNQRALAPAHALHGPVVLHGTVVHPANALYEAKLLGLFVAQALDALLALQGFLVLPVFATLAGIFVCVDAGGSAGWVVAQHPTLKCEWHAQYAVLMVVSVAISVLFHVMSTLLRALRPLAAYADTVAYAALVEHFDEIPVTSVSMKER